MEKITNHENSENTINNYLLLTSELKGYVEQPNYYFTDVTDKTRADLDLVMLTHGYRRFQWKQLLSESYPPVAYQPESDLEIAAIFRRGMERAASFRFGIARFQDPRFPF